MYRFFVLCTGMLLIVMTSLCLAGCRSSSPGKPVPARPFAVIAYYSGNDTLIDRFAVEKLTHIIFSFRHLNGNRLSIRSAGDSMTIRKLVSLKQKHPSLKVLLSLGGWGGCETCSPVFATEAGRREFASSVKELTYYFKTDGIDIDWEYPAIEGHPGHPYLPEDKPNFTSLIETLRDTLGPRYEISFAAGGFDHFLQNAVDWQKLMPLLDYVNLMSYDLVGGFSKVTGHHTPLYSNPQQKQSADNAVRYLDSIRVPLGKVVIGAAFYARQWDSVQAVNNGLYQAGVFRHFIPYYLFSERLSAANGFVFYRDSVSQAAYAYNPAEKAYATFDDSISVRKKTEYALAKGLGGLMFWELPLDLPGEGLLHVIDQTIHHTPK